MRALLARLATVFTSTACLYCGTSTSACDLGIQAGLGPCCGSCTH